LDRAGPTETHAFYLSTRHLPKKFIMKNFTLNDSKFEEFAKERHHARAIAGKPRHPNRGSAVDVRDLKSALLPVRAT
jgi:hypothetical protein